MPTFGSLFAGVGGFDMGFEQAGFRCQFQVEWDKHCQSVLNRHWPDIPKWGDVCDVDGSWLPHVDVLIFGSPCQDLSVAGKRSGLDGGRSSMFFEATRIIKEMQRATAYTYPRIVVWENVPGALTSNRGADFQVVLDEMADCGSVLTEWAVLDAQHFGVPQRRRRIFLVAVLDPRTANECPNPLLPVSEGRRGDYEKGIPKGKTVAGTLAESIGIDIGTAVKAKRAMSNVDDDRWEETDLSPTLNAFDNGGESRATVLAFTAQRVGEAPRIYEDSTPALLSRMGTGGNNTPMIVENNAYSIREDAKANTFSATPTDTALCVNALQPSPQSHHAQLFIAQHAIHAFDTQFGSNANVFNDMSPTLKSSQNAPSVQHEYTVRRLTPLECERLMGWPDDHTRWTAEGKEQSDSARYRQCGNGVATPVAKWIAQQLEPLL